MNSWLTLVQFHFWNVDEAIWEKSIVYFITTSKEGLVGHLKMMKSVKEWLFHEKVCKQLIKDILTIVGHINEIWKKILEKKSEKGCFKSWRQGIYRGLYERFQTYKHQMSTLRIRMLLPVHWWIPVPWLALPVLMLLTYA